MLAFANAKINIGLNITDKRADGYHNLETAFYPLKLYDVVELLDAGHTHCMVKGLDVPGQNQDNICLKAYDLLSKDFNLPPQKIVLLKNIPVGAGLGGGSSDAALVIRMLNDKFKLGLSVVQMQSYASILGADCAFFIENKPVMAYGIGNEFEDLDLDLSSYFKVLVKAPVHVATSTAYAGVKPSRPSSSLKDLIHLPLTAWRKELKNDFEPSVFGAHPEIEKIKEALYASGALFALMSGSGSAVYGLFTQPLKLALLEKENKVFYDV